MAKARSVPMEAQFAQNADGQKRGDEHRNPSGQNLGKPGSSKPGMHFAERRGQQAVLPHGVKNRGWPSIITRMTDGAPMR